MNILYLGTLDDSVYLSYLKPLVKLPVITDKTFVLTPADPISTFTEVQMYCQARKITRVISSNPTFLHHFIPTRAKSDLSNYAGSIFKKGGLEILFIHPLAQLVTIPYMSALTGRFITKITNPERWPQEVLSCYTLLETEEQKEQAYKVLSKAELISADIETAQDLSIQCIGYTAILRANDTVGFQLESFTLPITSMTNIAWMRKINSLPAGKIFQNGRYDMAYLTRYNAPLHNYLWDTATLFFCWYSEYPKDLAFLGAYFVREAMYWKDLGHTGNMQDRYLYCAKDTQTTALAFIYMLKDCPDYAIENYKHKFKIVFPAHLSEMTGLMRDQDRLLLAREEQKAKIVTYQTSLNILAGMRGDWRFNANSPQQVGKLFKVLKIKTKKPKGSKNPNAVCTDDKELKKAIFLSPFNARVLAPIAGMRKVKKLLGTYLGGDDLEKGNKDYRGFWLYSINPCGTDTGRTASGESPFWCGANIQNTPRGKEIKRTIKAPPGFLFGENDLAQAESRDTAYIAGEENLIAAVTGKQDFHSLNASAFFGRSYESIYSDELHKTLDKVIRDLAKRVNHGANYVMTAPTLLDTMGYEMVTEAKRLLDLPKLTSLLEVCEILLERFHAKYPGLRGTYYKKVKSDVKSTKKLVGATGWTRYCFGDPEKNKLDLNAYAAHCPQSLNAMVLDKAYFVVFLEIALHPEWGVNFRLHAPIHDSILHSFKEGWEFLSEEVRKRMEIPVTVTGADGKVRTFTVPADKKLGKEGKGAMYWSDVE